MTKVAPSNVGHVVRGVWCNNNNLIIIIIYFVKRKIHKSALNRYIIQYNAITQYMSKNNNSTSKMVDEKISCDSSIKGKLLKTFNTVNDENK